MGTSWPGALRITGPVASTDPRLAPAPWPTACPGAPAVTGPAPVAGMEGGALKLPGGVGPPDGVTRDLADVGRLPTPVGKGPMPHKFPTQPMIMAQTRALIDRGRGRGSDDLLICWRRETSGGVHVKEA